MKVSEKNFQDIFIESLPKSWGLGRIKDLGRIYGRIGYRGYTTFDMVEEGNGALSISPGNINNNSFTLKSKTFISWEKYYESPEIMIFQKDIILVKTGSTIGKVALIPEIDYKLTLNPQVVVLKNVKINNTFLYYFLTTDYIKYLFECFQSGGATPAISQEKINNFIISYPLLPEQITIAQYLDTKTKIIDKKIQLLEQKILHYKELRKSIINKAITKGLDDKTELKESGIDWIGKIPKHWEVKRLKDVFNSLAGGTPSTQNPEYWSGVIPWIPSGKVQNNYVNDICVEDYISEKALKESSTKIAKANSLLVALTGATCSNIGFLTFDTTINQSIVALSKSELIDEKFYFYFLLSAREKIRTYMTGGAQGGINQEDVKLLNIVYCNYEEQIQIAQYLDQKTTIIDQIVKNIETQIATLKELRKTLINDVVTGKIKVTND